MCVNVKHYVVLLKGSRVDGLLDYFDYMATKTKVVPSIPCQKLDSVRQARK